MTKVFYLPDPGGRWERIPDVVALSHPTPIPQPKERTMANTGYSQVHGDLDATSYVAPPEPESVRIARQNRERESNPNLIRDLAQDNEFFEMYKTTEAHEMSMKRRASHNGDPIPREIRETKFELLPDGRPEPAPYVTNHVIRPEDDSPEDRAFLRRAQQQDRPHLGGREMQLRETWRRADRTEALAEYHDALIQSFTG